MRRRTCCEKHNDLISISVISIMFLFIACGIICFFRIKSESRRKYEKLLQKIEQADKAKADKNDDTDFAISRDAEQAVLQSLKKFESGRKYLEKDLDLTKLAGHFNTNTKYLSLIILRHRNLKFNQYINSLKIDYIAKRIKNEKILQNYTHEALALEAGIPHYPTLRERFCKLYGITPKCFIDELKKEENIG